MNTSPYRGRRHASPWLLIPLIAALLAFTGCMERQMKVVVRGLVTPVGAEAKGALEPGAPPPVCYLVLIDPPSSKRVEMRDPSYNAVSEEVVRRVVVASLENKGYRVAERAAESDWFVIAFRGQANAFDEFLEAFVEEDDPDDEDGIPMRYSEQPQVGKDEMRSLILMGVPELARARVGTEAGKQLFEILGEDRWYVGLLAYDIRALVRGERKLMWATFVHSRAGDKLYSETLATLMATATEFLGEDTKGLTPKWVKVREGRVEVGELEVISSDPAPTTPPPPAPPAP